MKQFFGCFYAPRDLKYPADGFDAPINYMGRHMLAARQIAADGGAMAMAVGRPRNAAALKEALSQDGLHLSGDSTGALVLACYRRWGEDYPRHLEGVVVSAVIDQDSRTLILSRDAMGCLPLFYAHQGGCVAFADHPAKLFALSSIRPTVDENGLKELFALGPARTPGHTPFKDIRQLKPGCQLIAHEYQIRETPYFQIEARPHEQSEADTIETVREMVIRAVRDIAPLEPLSMLSGGLDSTVLTALLCKEISEPVHTLSVDYQDNARYFNSTGYQPDQDAPWVERAVKLLGTKHTRVVLPIEGLHQALEPAMAARGFPGMADVDSSLLLFGEKIALQGNVVLSGECGDEVFGGYPWFHRPDLIARDGFPWSGSLALRESILKPALRKRLKLMEYAHQRYHEALRRLPILPGEADGEARLRQIQGLCLSWFMPVLQERAQRMCGYSGVSVLTPYCDERLVQYVYNVPWTLKSLRGHEKGLLRQAMEGVLPEDLLWRKKSPYPKTYHPEYARQVCEILRAILEDRTAPLNQIIDKEAVTRIMEGSLSPADTPWFGQLMTGPQMLAHLIQMDQWMRAYHVEFDL